MVLISKPNSKRTHYRRNLTILLLILIIGIVTFYLCLTSHNDSNIHCHCLQCLMNYVPEDGEYLYNRYLPLISLLWILLIFLPIYFFRHRKK